jgi:hypothetical protein
MAPRKPRKAKAKAKSKPEAAPILVDPKNDSGDDDDDSGGEDGVENKSSSDSNNAGGESGSDNAATTASGTKTPPGTWKAPKDKDKDKIVLASSSDESGTEPEKTSRKKQRKTKTVLASSSDESGTEPEKTSRKKQKKTKRKKTKKRKKKSSKRAKRRSSSSASSSSDNGGRGRKRRRSPSTSSSSSEDSEWEDFEEHPTCKRMRALLEKDPPKTPSDVKKGAFAMDARGNLLVVRKGKGRGKERKWMKETPEERSDRFADLNGMVSRLSHVGREKDLRRDFGAALKPLKAVEKALLHCPMSKEIFKDLSEARKILNDRVRVLSVERETNPTVAAMVENRQMTGLARNIAMAVEKYDKPKKFNNNNSNNSGGGYRSAYNRRVGRAGPPVGYPNPPPPPPPASFQAPSFGGGSGYGGGFTRPPPNNGNCYACDEPGHRRGDPRCKKK